jgi:hypothetical protein
MSHEQSLPGDLSFQMSQSESKAGMDSSTERQLLVRGTLNVECFRIWKLSGIDIGGGQERDHELPLLNRFTVQFHVFCGETWFAHLHGGRVAQNFVDRSLSQRPIGGQLSSLVGMLQQSEQAD